MADEALVGGSVEGAFGDSHVVDTLSSDAQLEALPAGKADVAGRVAVVAVPGTGQDEPEEKRHQK